MNLAFIVAFRLRRFWEETVAQDLVEYALMAGFVSCTAGAIMPGVATSISKIMSTVGAMMADSSRSPNG